MYRWKGLDELNPPKHFRGLRDTTMIMLNCRLDKQGKFGERSVNPLIECGYETSTKEPKKPFTLCIVGKVSTS